MLSLIGSSAPGVAQINEEVSRLRGELVAHAMFASAASELKSKVLSGNTPPFHLSHSDRNRHSGVNNDYYNATVMFLSSYVHTFPISIHQLMQFRAGEPESLSLLSLPIQYATGFLAKGIEGMRAVFGEALPRPDEPTCATLNEWIAIVERGVRNAR